MAIVSGVMDSIVILDDDEDDPQPCSSTSSSGARTNEKARKGSCPAPTHITQSPFASSKKESHVIQLENQRLFGEFLEHCATHTKDCTEGPAVMAFLKAKHSKASPEFLSSVEFRNTVGRCLTRAQSCRGRTFVYINELCTVLKQHATKKRQNLVTLPQQPETPSPPPPMPGPAGDQEAQGPAEPTEEQPSTSTPEEEEEKKKTAKASRRQIAYLENLLKVYYEEIRRLQEKELSLEDLKEEDSGYIQEHKLKRKMMKIYDKLCELKGCTTLTGRVIEQRVLYSGTRYPEINKKVERFINSPEAQMNPPDYSDILRVVRRANERYTLSLSRKQLTQIAQDAFRETGNRLQERRHLDMVFNFGSHLTDSYKPALDPALTDPTLARKLRANREVALSSLDEVISKYTLQQDDAEEEERRKRLERDKAKKETLAAQEGEGKTDEKDEESKKAEGERKGEEEEEEEGGESEVDEQQEEEDGDDEEEVSSDPDIEEELQASQEGADDEEDEEEEEETNASEEEQRLTLSCSDAEAEAEQNGAEDSQSASSSHGEAARAERKGVASPSQSEAATDMSSNGTLAKDESISTNHVADDKQKTNRDSVLAAGDRACPSPLAANQHPSPQSPALDSSNRVSPPVITESRSANCSPAPPSPVTVTPNSKKRKRTSKASTTACNGRYKHNRESDSDISLDMGVVSSSPLQADSTHIDSLPRSPSAAQSTPRPPRRTRSTCQPSATQRK
ncbi:hypothetical protein AGOR_G00044060 [Albula goreensis]|uniref:Death domain-associated protein 6 n=1 Tax=Albula goreensis TaxID=1534307 RepID=A0A8T3DYH6_9TELE|nr:hypothetical protein AGOR_G00044060 [Albula goreensis]